MKSIEDVTNKVIVEAVAKDIKKSIRSDELAKRKSGEALSRDLRKAGEIIRD